MLFRTWSLSEYGKDTGAIPLTMECKTLWGPLNGASKILNRLFNGQMMGLWSRLNFFYFIILQRGCGGILATFKKFILKTFYLDPKKEPPMAKWDTFGLTLVLSICR